MKNNNYYGLFYKNRGKTTGPFGGFIYSENEIRDEQVFIKSWNRTAKKSFKLKKLSWK